MVQNLIRCNATQLVAVMPSILEAMFDELVSFIREVE